MVKIHFFMKSSLLRCVSLLLFEKCFELCSSCSSAIHVLFLSSGGNFQQFCLCYFKFSCSYFYQKANFTQMQLLSQFVFCFVSLLLFLFLSQSLLMNTVFVNFSYWCCRIMSQVVMLYINLSQLIGFVCSGHY